MSVQTKEGTLKSKAYTGVEVYGNGFTLKGDTVLSTKKIIRFQGKVLDENNAEIGSFAYADPDGADMMNDPAGSGTSEARVTLSHGVDSKYQRPANTLMYAYVDKMNEELKKVEE